MYVIGKLIGSFLGFLIAGPSGAIIGAIFGNLFDKGLAKQFKSSYHSFDAEDNPKNRSAFIKTVACLMGLIAKADGRVSEQELKFAKHVFKALNLDKTEQDSAIQWFTSSKNGQISFEDLCRMLQNLKTLNQALCRSCLDITYQMATIDGLDGKKLHALNQLLAAIGFAPLNMGFHSQQQSHTHPFQPPSVSQIHRAYQTLGLDQNADKDMVKRSYRKLIGKYHPDRLIARGASPQELKLATEKTQEISKAYQYICDHKGW